MLKTEQKIENKKMYVKKLHDKELQVPEVVIYYGVASCKLRGDVEECDMQTSRLKFRYAF